MGPTDHAGGAPNRRGWGPWLLTVAGHGAIAVSAAIPNAGVDPDGGMDDAVHDHVGVDCSTEPWMPLIFEVRHPDVARRIRCWEEDRAPIRVPQPEVALLSAPQPDTRRTAQCHP